VHFAGHQPNSAPYLDAMDMFVLPVPSGSMSIGLLEAMARGLPSIITFGGPEEAVIDCVTGLTSPPHDPPALAKTIEKLANNPELRRALGEAGSAHVRAGYSVGRVADDLLMVYRCRRSPLPGRLLADSATAAARVQPAKS
jgi:glycosyltransferase involved in cell wall biosynthesis